MRSVLFALVATVAAFSLTSMAEAGGCHRGGYGFGGHGFGGHGFGGYRHCHGGYCAPRFGHYNYNYNFSQLGCLPYSYHGWARRCWFPRYNCYGYFCPTRSCWFFY